MRKLVSVLGLSLGLAAGAAQAALITEVFQVTLPTASGPYAAGHVFQITATYDDTDPLQTLSEWSDGENGVAEFGKGDDGPAKAVKKAASKILNVNAAITIVGLLDLGSPPLNYFDKNYAHVTAGRVDYQADSIAFSLSRYYAFDLRQYSESTVVQVASYGDDIITRTVAFVPEPASLALLGLGMAGFAVARRRKQ